MSKRPSDAHEGTEPAEAAPDHAPAEGRPTDGDGEPHDHAFPLVGIGISAGGLEPLGKLLASLGDAPGLAVVIVPHLDPSHESQLVSLLQQKTSLSIGPTEQGSVVEVDHVYVLSPNASVTLSDGTLVVAPRKETRGAPHPIDRFFRSLAEEWESRAIGVVLSGTLNDGTEGLRDIRGAGGFTFAQDPETAEFSGMPDNAISAGVVDFVLDPEQIGEELARLKAAPYVRDDEGIATDATQEGALSQIFQVVRARTGIDFSGYKRTTVLRRIHRRMTALRTVDLATYAGALRSRPDEATALRDDLLINVTRFFREWAILEPLKDGVLDALLEDRSDDDPIRIWVAGCATGEEAYSLAITISEFLRERDRGASLQIFGTDINEAAIEVARAGHYPHSIRDDVPDHLLARYFDQVDGGYRVNRALRGSCIFAVHDLARDPPFSRMDLVSCRNVLIYLQPKLQRVVLTRLHYALNEKGYLVLGSSEAIGRYNDLFEPLGKKQRIFRKTGHSSPATYETKAAGVPVGAHADEGPGTVRTDAEARRAADRYLLDRYAPPAVLVNDALEIIEFRNDTSPFLMHGPGPASLQLVRVVREGLASELRAAIRDARLTGQPARRESAQVRGPKGQLQVDVEVIPVGGPRVPAGCMLITFQQHPPDAPPPVERDTATAEQGHDSASERADQLERELHAARDYLHTVVDDYEATNEELRSVNEEAMSTNEELQSTNEELETAKEELQSTNEELTTLNEELASRNEEIQKVSSDVVNLLNSVNIPIVMLAPDLRIRRFTNSARHELNLITGDVGRPFTDIALPFPGGEVERGIRLVMETLQRRVLQLEDRSGQPWIVEISPYRTLDDRIEGVVLVARRQSASDTG